MKKPEQIKTPFVVSIVKDATSTATRHVEAEKLIENIRTGRYRAAVEKIRQKFSNVLAKSGDRKAAKKAVDSDKKKLPGVLWSGRFSRRKKEALLEHSGLLCIDFDGLGEQLDGVWQRLRTSLYLWAIFRSPTGDGIKAIFRVPADAQKHRRSFLVLQAHVEEITGVHIDESGKDQARLCFVSYDRDAGLNTTAAELPLPLDDNKAVPQSESFATTDQTELRRSVAVELLGEVRWDADTHGFLDCPGKHLHETDNGERDCELHLDRVATVHCFHNHCGGIIAGVNHELRSRIFKAERANHLPVTPSKWFRERFPSLAGKYGDAVLEKIDKNGILTARDIGEDFLAATLSDKGTPDSPTIFVPTEEKFYTYLPNDGIFIHQREPVFLAHLSRLLLECARECRNACETCDLEFRLRDSATLSGVLRKARGLLAAPPDFFSTDLTDFIPCSNGMLRLKDKKLLPFSPSYQRRNKLAVPFDPSAKCPLFLDTLMRPALDDDGLDLMQRWCGLVLIGENLAQRILMLIGTAGGGKGTVIRVICGIIGLINLASLRPQLLGERFELGRFLGRTLLYGADVPANFLDQRGATVLKSLTGYDPVTLEFKNSNESPSIICRFNVAVTCNSRLTVRLEGDVEAWRRRLAIIEYHKPKPEKVIADLDRQILEAESSGVLNWMLKGLDKLRADNWLLVLTANQQAVVDNLLLESDGVAVFARECLKSDPEQTLTVSDIYTVYVEFCTQHGWTAFTRNKFTPAISDEVVRRFGITTRNDIPDSKGKAQRGWKGLACTEKFSQWTDETVSEASANERSDTSDTLFTVQSAEIPTGEEQKLVEEFV